MPPFHYLSVNKHLSWLHFLAIVNSPAIKMSIQISVVWWIGIFTHPELQLYYIVALRWVFWGLDNSLPNDISTRNVQEFLFTQVLTSIITGFFFLCYHYYYHWRHMYCSEMEIELGSLRLRGKLYIWPAPVIGCLCNYLNQSKMESPHSFSWCWWLNTPSQIRAFVFLLFRVLFFFEIGSVTSKFSL